MAEPTDLPAGHVLLRNLACGICGSDVHIYHWHDYFARRLQDRLPRILGHEVVSEVVAVGDDVDGLAPGDRVVLDPTPGCGTCSVCVADRPDLCEHRLSIMGGLAEYSVVPQRALHKAPSSLDALEACLLEPLGISAHAIERTGTRPGESAVVLGAGPIGLFLIQALKADGVAPVIVTGTSRSERRLRLAKELGADEVIVADKEPVKERVHKAVGPKGADNVYEAAGTTPAMEQALQIVRPGGKVCLAGITDPILQSKALAISREKGIELICARSRTGQTWRRVNALAETRMVRFAPLIDLVLPMDKALQAFDALTQDRSMVKVVVLPATDSRQLWVTKKS